MSDTVQASAQTQEPITDARQPAGRVIVELAVDGTLWLERYTNGARTRTVLDRGNEWWQIVDELHMQRRNAISAAERKAAKAEEQSRKRHREVWTTAAERQGIGFAKDVIKGEVPIGYGKHFTGGNASAKAEPKVKAGPSGPDMADLL